MPSKTNSRKINIAAVFLTAVISFLILIPIVNSVHIPLEKSDTGIVSLVTIKNTSPYTNYVKFLILLLVPSLVAIVSINTTPDLVNRLWRASINITQKARVFLSNRNIINFSILILILAWTVNRNYSNLNWILIDTFHEGEYLGFLPNFLTFKQPFLRSFMIHGFGLDVLTSLIAVKLSDHSNTVVLTRFFRMTQGAIGYLGCYWIIWELVLSVKLKSQKQSVFLLLCLIFTISDGIFFKFFTGIFAGRDTLFILQLGLIIRFFRITKDSLYNTEKLLLPILIGISIPVSFLYVYDRAAYFIPICLLACGLSTYFEQRTFNSFLSRATFGLAISSVLVTIILGTDQVSEILSQVLFWARNGRYIAFNILPAPSVSSFFIWVRLSFATLTQIFAVIYLVLAYKNNSSFKIFLRSNCLLVVLLLASLIYMRITLDKPSNVNYVGSSSLISMLLLIYLGLIIFKFYFEDKVNSLIQEPLLKRLVVLFMFLTILLNPVLNPVLSLVKLNELHTTYKTPDMAVIKPDLLQTYNTLKSEISQLSCFFTLSQEGLWYYLFNKPSCSKFSIIYYARTTDAQEIVVRETEARKPNVILFSSLNRGNVFEGIPISDAVPIIYEYFLNHYQPYVLVQSQWFWKRSRNQLDFIRNRESNGSHGSIDTVLSEITLKGALVSLSGTVTFPSQSKMADAVYVSYGENNQLVEVTKVDRNAKWTVPVPTMSLPAGKGVLRVWSHASESNQLVQIGEDIKIDLVARYSFQKTS